MRWIILVVPTCFIALACFFAIITLCNHSWLESLYTIPAILILGLAIIYLVTHLLRILRFYILLAEHNVKFRALVNEYFPASFVSFIVPFKLGEIYRIYRFSLISRNSLAGILCVWLERLFDAAIIIFLLGIALVTNSLESKLLLFLLSAFILGSLMCYFSVSFGYIYLNNYFLTAKHDKSSIRILYLLDIVNIFRESAKKLISGRLTILLFLTICIWLLELVEIYTIIKVFNDEISINMVSLWINSIYGGLKYAPLYLSAYYIIGLLILLIASISCILLRFKCIFRRKFK